MRFAAFHLVIAVAHAAWCTIEFDAVVSRRTVGRACELLRCETCDDSCVGRLDARTLVVADTWLWRLEELTSVAAAVDCSRLSAPVDPPAGDQLVLFLYPDGGSTAQRVALWTRVFPACAFQQLQGAPSAVVVRGCAWHALRAIHGSVMIARTHARARLTAAAPGTRLQNRWSANSAGLPVDGTGQVVGAIDTGAAMASCFLRDHVQPSQAYTECGPTGAPPPTAVPVSYPSARKVVQYVHNGGDGAALCGASGDTSGHGTHTASTIAGNPLCASTCPVGMNEFSGAAPGAKLALFDAGPDSDGYLVIPADVSLAYAWALRAGAAVHSDSWGADGGGLYSELDYATDAWMALHPEVLVVAAAGNNGDQTESPYVQSPGLSKNALTVGATYASADARTPVYCGSLAYASNPAECSAINGRPEGATADFSARGSRSGAGRAKPDLMAPGDTVWSALNVNLCGQRREGGATFWERFDLQPMAGTSMATPIVAGWAALVRQFFADGYYPCTSPSAGRAWSVVPSALVRAVLVLAAETHVPSPPRGYGSLSGLRGLLSSDGAFSVLGGVSPQLAVTGAVHSYALCATASSTVRASLAWTDPPSFVDDPTSGLLINDLDLVVLVNGASAFLGNGARDRTSTLEAVRIPGVTPGDSITVQVLARRVLGSAAQSYALVVSGAAACNSSSGVACPTTTPTVRSQAVTDAALVVDAALGYAVLVATGALSTGESLAFEMQISGPPGVYYATVPQSNATTTCGAPSDDWVYGPFLVLRENASSSISLSFSATPSGHMFWRSQRLLFCGAGGEAWVDVTGSACVHGAQPESDAPVRICGSGPANGTYVLVDVHDESRWDVVCAPGGWGGCTCAVPYRWGYWDFSQVAMALLGGIQVVAVVGVRKEDLAGLAVAVSAAGRFGSQPAAILLVLASCIPVLIAVAPLQVPKSDWVLLAAGSVLVGTAAALEMALGPGEDPSVAWAALLVPAAAGLLPSTHLLAVLVFAGAGAASLDPALTYTALALVLVGVHPAARASLWAAAAGAALNTFVYLFAPCSPWPWAQ